jgi:hypothetical protein
MMTTTCAPFVTYSRLATGSTFEVVESRGSADRNLAYLRVRACGGRRRRRCKGLARAPPRRRSRSIEYAIGLRHGYMNDEKETVTSLDAIHSEAPPKFRSVRVTRPIGDRMTSRARWPRAAKSRDERFRLGQRASAQNNPDRSEPAA